MPDDKFIIPFGKYKGEYLCDLPTSYIEWLEDNIESDKIRNLATAELSYREKDGNYNGGDSQ
jgi:hypothetical protein